MRSSVWRMRSPRKRRSTSTAPVFATLPAFASRSGCLEKGVRVAVIKGGLRAWKKAGLPLEPVPPEEMTKLPLFD